MPTSINLFGLLLSMFMITISSLASPVITSDDLPKVSLTIPEYSQYTSSNSSSSLLGTKSIDIVDLFFDEKSSMYNTTFFWGLYTPRNDRFKRRSTLQYNMTCHIAATAYYVINPFSFDLTYEKPYVNHSPDSSIRLWCPPEEVVCMHKSDGECNATIPLPLVDSVS
ncbi:uncharacterized protein IL334_005700 [Kwoniella shivajii]|uniref:Uncharacterized protein n=1 Tax=Kwoniella shivajii TaxID=564305 RepID=A0ABZ1D5R0_9TREE|nr:hypothetical protein IL334_005700 [Kwoniella shivajii]